MLRLGRSGRAAPAEALQTSDQIVIQGIPNVQGPTIEHLESTDLNDLI